MQMSNKMTPVSKTNTLVLAPFVSFFQSFVTAQFATQTVGYVAEVAFESTKAPRCSTKFPNRKAHYYQHMFRVVIYRRFVAP
jgi:hypothetical protein